MRTGRSGSIFALGFLAIILSGAGAAEVMPPKPPRYLNDYADVIPADVEARLNKQLEDFERATSSQVVVAIYPKMESDSSVQDYTHRVAEAWGVGQKDKDNGAVLFVFIQNREMFLQVGYGLEGAIPDITAKAIIEDVIKPRFRQGDYAGGVAGGINAIQQAARGEYKGTGRTVGDRRRGRNAPPGALLVLFIVIALVASTRRRHGTMYHGSGRRRHGGSWPIFTSGSGWGGGGFSVGGFSGGGGSFGGGGAGGRW